MRNDHSSFHSLKDEPISFFVLWVNCSQKLFPSQHRKAGTSLRRDLDIRSGKRLDSASSKWEKKVRSKDLDAVIAACEAAGMTKRQAVLTILGAYAERGQLGPHLLAACQRLAREEQMGLPRLIQALTPKGEAGANGRKRD